MRRHIDKGEFWTRIGQVRTPWRQGTEGLLEWGATEDSHLSQLCKIPVGQFELESKTVMWLATQSRATKAAMKGRNSSTNTVLSAPKSSWEW
jgi:hypothetical protein